MSASLQKALAENPDDPESLAATAAASKLMYPVLRMVSEHVILRSREIHAAVQAKEAITRRPTAVLVLLDSFLSIERRVTAELIDLGAAVRSGFYRPASNKGVRVNPRQEFLLLVSYVGRVVPKIPVPPDMRGRGVRPIEPKLTMPFRVRGDAGEHYLFRLPKNENVKFVLSQESAVVIRESEGEEQMFLDGERTCANHFCAKEGGQVRHKCSRCKDARYHGKECQDADWSGHKQSCGLVWSGKKDMREMSRFCTRALQLTTEGHPVAIRCNVRQRQAPE